MFVSPMLLQSNPVPPDDEKEWITELKLDGHRMILSRFDGKTTLYTRHNNNVTLMYPEIASIDIKDGTILDGELIALDSNGKPDFEMLQLRSRSKKLINSVNIQFVAFDILYHGNEKVMFKPLTLRKELIPTVIPNDQHFVVAHNYIEGNAATYFDLVSKMDLEGIVVKNPNSLYKKNTRSKEWLKVINYSYEEVFLSGYRKDDFGILAVDENGKCLGTIEHMGIPARKEFYKKAKDLITGEDKKYVYIKPTLKCKVKYRNLTKNGLLRIPVFMEWL
ncbi:ATP-dependent DNA ligase [Alkalihalobacillus sp. NPDC078783]